MEEIAPAQTRSSLQTTSPSRFSKWYFYCILIFAISLPFSKFGLSVSQFLILIIWVVERDFRNKWRALVSNPIALGLISIYLIHLIGLAYSQDFDYAMKDLRIKMPLLSFTIFASWIFPLERKYINQILNIFSLAVLVGVFIAFYRIFFIALDDIREASIFVSHIRFSLMICTAIFIAFYNVIRAYHQYFYLALALFLIGSLFILESITGLIVLSAAAFFLSIYLTINRKGKTLGLSLTALFLIAISIASFQLKKEFDVFYSYEAISDPSTLEYASASGEVYYHKIESTLHENGTLIWSYIAFKELEKAWIKKSELGFKEQDAKGQPVYSTLIRYMSSKGLRKDSIDFLRLSEADIELIEMGHTNHLYANNSSIKKRVYETLWEIENLKNGRNPEGNSVAQRLVFWATGWQIFKENFWLGVGTGDVKVAFEKAYEAGNTELSTQFRHRAHNQYLSIAIAFGLFGLLFFLFFYFKPLYFQRDNLLLLLFLICSGMSFLSEDTIETQIGISYIVFFYCLFGMNKFSWKAQHKA